MANGGYCVWRDCCRIPALAPTPRMTFTNALPCPEILSQISAQSKLVYYGLGVTGARIQSCLYITQTLAGHFPSRSIARPNLLSAKCLQSLVPRLGNCATEMTFTDCQSPFLHLASPRWALPGQNCNYWLIGSNRHSFRAACILCWPRQRWWRPARRLPRHSADPSAVTFSQRTAVLPSLCVLSVSELSNPRGFAPFAFKNLCPSVSIRG